MAAEDAINEAKSRVETLVAAIDGGVGVDVTYDEAFEALKNEVDKMQSLSGGKVDWGSMVSGADQLLSDKSKDFRVALYYAAAKTHLDKLSGLLDGLVLVQSLTSAYWDAMYPALKRPKARGNLCAWFGEVANGGITGTTPTAKDRDVVNALDQVSRAVDADLRDKLGESYGGFGDLMGTIRSLVTSLPKEAPPPPPPPPPPPSPPPVDPSAPAAAAPPAPVPAAVATTAAAGPSVASITDAESALSVVGKCSLLLARAGDALRVAGPKDPSAYRILRAGLWLEVSGDLYSPAGDGVTALDPPPDHVRQAVPGLSSSGSPADVLPVADELAANYPFWLDPHRHMAASLDQLGDEYAPAKRALLIEVGHLLLRAPALPEMKFNDGMPFADDETKAWIQAEVKPAIGGAGGAAQGAGKPKSYIDKPLAEARALVANEQPAEAMALLTKAAAAAPTPLDRFKVKLALAQILMQIQQLAIARAQLEALEQLIEQHRLADWQPELCAEVYAALYACHRTLNQGYEAPPEAKAKETLSFERLCQLDAALAFKLATPG